MKKYKHKPTMIEVIQFDGENYLELMHFIGVSQLYYTSYLNGFISNLGVESDGLIFWLKPGCWLSKEDGICYPKENSFDDHLHRNYDEI